MLGVALLVQAGVAFAAQPLMLWEASGRGGTVYLFGSIHVCTAACFPLSPSILERFDASDALLVELDAEQRDARKSLLEAGRLRSGKTLSSMLTPSGRALLRQVLTSLDVPPDAVESYRPWLVALMLSVQAANRAGFDTSQGIDVSLMARGRAQRKPLLELESADRQVLALSAGSDAEQIEALQRQLEQIASGKSSAMLNDLLQAWKAGDTDAIVKMLAEDMPEDSTQAKALLTTRNREMAKAISARSRQGGRYFVVIGAAHLVGRTGVPALLAQQGFRVQQIRDGE